MPFHALYALDMRSLMDLARLAQVQRLLLGASIVLAGPFTLVPACLVGIRPIPLPASSARIISSRIDSACLAQLQTAQLIAPFVPLTTIPSTTSLVSAAR